MKLSIPKPTKETLPASSPALTAIRPSRLFYAIVKYSICFPRWAITARAIGNLLIQEGYQLFFLEG